ncbi:hypothetical protein DNK47_02070 [Mycoplasma wenyonii]|uniref:Uncharacterized protein n=1 Tax=Mycoplasma wenyonii TaxID=65123 RepID=A0A328PU86_9MOLU|nr:hypothetical protein [Mycoplasma wenyonii]RAO94981.1 hypothetical protein DNK47_02070 [Mycoplasma wenyonii]
MFSKFALSAIVAGAGGTAIGIPLSSSSQTNSSSPVTLTSTHQNKPDALSGPAAMEPTSSIPSQLSHDETVNLQDASHSGTTSEDLLQAQSLGMEATSLEETRPLEETLSPAEPEGNCTVMKISEKILKKLPPLTSSSYISITCESDSVDEYSMLRKWKGFFPTSLLTEGTRSLIENTKIKIDVREISDELSDVSYQAEDTEDGEEFEPYETIFISGKFLKNSLTGKWGSAVVTREEDEEEQDDVTLYVVNLSKSSITDNFYILSE